MADFINPLGTNVFEFNFKRLKEAGKIISFNESLKNPNGFFDAITNDSSITEQSVFIDEKGRCAIVTPTPFGNAVVFERFVNDGSGIHYKVFDANIPSEIRKLFGGLLSGEMSNAAIAAIVDVRSDTHLGDRLKDVVLATA